MDKDKNYRIYIDNRGNWYQDGIPVTHRWTYLENNRNLDIDSNGEYFIDEGMGRIYVEVEDTPFVVKMVDFKNDTIYLILNDETTEVLNPEDLSLNKDNIPYTHVKNGKFKARFLRPAYYELMKNAVQEDDGFYILNRDSKIEVLKK